MYFYECGFGIAGSDCIGASSICFCNIEDTTIKSSEFRLYLHHLYRVIIHDHVLKITNQHSPTQAILYLGGI